jgi:hypothetical protein
MQVSIQLYQVMFADLHNLKSHCGRSDEHTV